MSLRFWGKVLTIAVFLHCFQATLGLRFTDLIGDFTSHIYESNPKTIRSGQELHGLRLDFEKPSYIEIETPLAQVSSGFEVRVSYPGSVPSSFQMRLVDLEDMESQNQSDFRSLVENKIRFRRLDTAQFRIWSDSNGMVLHQVEDTLAYALKRPAIELKAFRASVPVDRSADAKFIRFNLALEPLILFDTMPHSAVRMIFWGIVTVSVAFFFLAPCIRRVVEFVP